MPHSALCINASKEGCSSQRSRFQKLAPASAATYLPHPSPTAPRIAHYVSSDSETANFIHGGNLPNVGSGAPGFLEVQVELPSWRLWCSVCLHKQGSHPAARMKEPGTMVQQELEHKRVSSGSLEGRSVKE